MSNLTMIHKQLEMFEQHSDGILGVSALHIESNSEINFNEQERFLMCSTYKLPMAICLLQKVECGEIRLTDMIEVNEFDLRPGALFTLNQFDYSTPVQISIANLLKLMLQESCNTSTDLLLRLMGGPRAVMACLGAAGIHDMSVDRYTIEAISAWDGITQLPSDHRLTLKQYQKLEQAVLPESLTAARELFKLDMRDTASPKAMRYLLTKLVKYELINANNSEYLLKIMRGCKRGSLRLMGLLPCATPVAHKTGTLTGYTCDVGIIHLPHQYGRIAIAAYIKNSNQDLANNERVLAEVGRSIYDYFLLN